MGAQTDLPAGLTFRDNGSGVATISGTPTAPAGTLRPRYREQHGWSPVTQVLTIIVGTPPTVITPNFASFTAELPTRSPLAIRPASPLGHHLSVVGLDGSPLLPPGVG